MAGAGDDVSGSLAEVGALGQTAKSQGLSVVNIWQDAVAQRWADQFWKQMRRHLGSINLQGDSWQVEELTQESPMRAAAMAAERADVIVIAVRVSESPPDPLRQWMEFWIPRRSGQDGVLVALLGVSGPSAGWLEQTRKYLRSLTRRGHLDLVIEECPDSGGPARPDPDEFSESVAYGHPHL